MNVDFAPKHLYFLWVVWKLSGGLWCTGTDAMWVELMMSRQSCLCFVSDTSLPVKCCGAVHGAALGVMLTAAMFLLITMHKHMHEQTNNNMDTDTIPHSCPFCSSGILNPLDYILEKLSNLLYIAKKYCLNQIYLFIYFYYISYFMEFQIYFWHNWIFHLIFIYLFICLFVCTHFSFVFLESSV